MTDDGVTVRPDCAESAPPQKPTRIIKCPHCGGRRYAGPGVHGPRWGTDPATIVDCVGRVCRRGPAGYWEAAP